MDALSRARDVRELTKCIFMGMFETLFSRPIGGRRKKDGRAPAGRYSFLAIVSSRPREATIIVRRRHASRYDVIYTRRCRTKPRNWPVAGPGTDDITV